MLIRVSSTSKSKDKSFEFYRIRLAVSSCLDRLITRQCSLDVNTTPEVRICCLSAASCTLSDGRL